MPTTPSSLASPNGEKTSEILLLKGQLNEYGIDPDRLVLLFLGANEMVMGEDLQYTAIDSVSRGLPQPILLKDPKRMIRLQGIDRATGALNTELRFSDFDMVLGGDILIQHSGGFRFHWLDEESQLNYLRAYRGFVESRRLSSARAAGIHLPGLSS